MELSLIMKIRITVAIAIGIILIGIFAWPTVEIKNPFDPVSVISGSITKSAMLKLTLWSVAATLIAFLVSWPYGKYIAALAAPFGIAWLAIRGGNMTELIRQNPTAEMRFDLYQHLRWETVYWLGLILLNLFIVKLCSVIFEKIEKGDTYKFEFPKTNTLINAAACVAIVVLFSKFLMMFLAQAVTVPDNKLERGFIIAQVSTAQIFFAAVLTFGLAAFLIKKFLGLGFIWPIIAAAILQPLVYTIYLKPEVFEHLAQYWPVSFYYNSTASILPIEMVSFASIGAITGYWMAVRSINWQKNEI